jgi:hypothetical protein
LRAANLPKPLEKGKSWGKESQAACGKPKWRCVMKNIRNLVTLVGLTVVFFALSATGARAQSLSNTRFSGTFTLPFEAQWGPVTLQPGAYNLYYGRLTDGGSAMVEVVGKENRRPHVLILSQGVNPASTRKSALVCIREGNVGIIRVLEMPQLGEAVEFKMPHGTQLMAQNRFGSKNVQIAEGPKLIQRIPVTLTK